MEMSSDLFRQLVEKNEVCVAEKHRLTRAQVKAICSEALDGNWPMPAERLRQSVTASHRTPATPPHSERHRSPVALLSVSFRIGVRALM
jgi:hypothetical protein